MCSTFRFPLFSSSHKTSSQTFCPLPKINQLQIVVSFISALWIKLCFCSSLSISPTSGCLFPHRFWKQRRGAPRIPRRRRVSKRERRMNPSPSTLQPTPRCEVEPLQGLGMTAWAGHVYKSASWQPGAEATLWNALIHIPLQFPSDFPLLVLRKSSWHNRKNHSPKEVLLRNPHLAGHLRHYWFLLSFFGVAYCKLFSIIRFADILINLHHSAPFPFSYFFSKAHLQLHQLSSHETPSCLRLESPWDLSPKVCFRRGDKPCTVFQSFSFPNLLHSCWQQEWGYLKILILFQHNSLTNL